MPRARQRRRSRARGRRRSSASTKLPSLGQNRTPQPREQLVQQRLRFAHLREIPLEILAIAERRRQRGRGVGVEACTAGSARRIGASVSAVPTSAPARSPARPYAFANVRPMTRFGNRAGRGVVDQRLTREVGVGLVQEDQRRAARPARPPRHCPRGIDRPVGLFGTGQEDDPGPRGDRLDHPRQRERRSPAASGTSTIRAAHGVGAGRVHVERRLRRRSLRSGSAAVAPRRVTSDATRMPSSSPLVRTTWSRETPKCAAAASIARVVVGVVRRRARGSGCCSTAMHRRRTAGGVLVEVEAQRAVLRLRPLVLVAHRRSSSAASRAVVASAGGRRRRRMRTEAAWAVRPSASASATAAGPMRSQAVRGDPLHRRDADEVRRAQTAAGRGRAAGRQHVIRAGHVVAARLRAVVADEHRARRG